MIFNKKISAGQYIGKSGFIDYEDTSTTASPMSVTTVYTKIPNNGLGANTIKQYAPDGVTDILNTSTSQFDFSDLKLGDMVSYRLNLTITTTANNQEIFFITQLALGSGNVYSSTSKYFQFKSIGAYPITIDSYFDMGNLDTLNNSGGFYIKSDTTATLINHGVRFKITLY